MHQVLQAGLSPPQLSDSLYVGVTNVTQSLRPTQRIGHLAFHILYNKDIHGESYAK